MSHKKIVKATARWIMAMVVPEGPQDAANLALIEDQLRQVIDTVTNV